MNAFHQRMSGSDMQDDSGLVGSLCDALAEFRVEVLGHVIFGPPHQGGIAQSRPKRREDDTTFPRSSLDQGGKTIGEFKANLSIDGHGDFAADEDIYRPRPEVQILQMN